MSDFILLAQDTVPRPLSIREKLSHLAWQQGIACFFTQNVPFSYSSSFLFASKVADTIAAFISQLPAQPSPIGWLELGSGLGLLARHLMDALQTRFPAMYENSQFLCTDYAPALTERLKNSGLFAAHTSHILFDEVDANAPVFDRVTQPTITWMSYLLDSLATRHFEVKNGTIFELQVQTRIKPDAKILDSRDLPPRILEGPEIVHILQTGSDADLQALGPMLTTAIEEHLIPVPLDQTDLNEPFRAHLQAFVTSLQLPEEGTFRWNIPMNARAIFQAWVAQTPEQSLFMINDFGYISHSVCPEPGRLTKGYGAVACYSVYFPYLCYLAKECGLTPWTTLYPDGHTQLMILIKGPVPEGYFPKLKELFQEAGYDHVQSIVDQVLGFRDSPEENVKKTQALWDSLPSAEKEDYLIILSCAAACFDDGCYLDCIRFANQMPKIYDPLAIPTYQLLGKSYNRLGDFDKARFYFNLSLSISPSFAAAHNELSLMYLKQQHYEAYLSHALTFVQASREWIIWEQLITLAMVQTKMGQLHKARALCNWLKTSFERYPTLIPETVKNKADILLSSFLNESPKQGNL